MRPRRDAVLVELDGRDLLFCEGQQRLYAFDRITAILWRAATAAADPRAASVSIQLGLDVSQDEAEACLASRVTEWAEAGLLETTEDSVDRPPSAGHTGGAVEASFDDVFPLAGLRVGINYADDRDAAAVRSIFGHLHACELPADIGFCSTRENGTYRLIGSQGTDRRMLDPAAVAVTLKADVLEAILQRHRRAMAIHAAALMAPNGALLLAGRSGSGKSTLAALLNASGLDLIADDVVLVDVEDARIRGLPLAFALKHGSWPVLGDVFPELASLVTYKRPDGRPVRYLPSTSIVNDGMAAKVACVVFPSFEEGRTTVLSALPRADALVRILRDARNGDHRLTIDAFRGVTSLLNASMVGELAFSNASDAVALLLASAREAFSSGRNTINRAEFEAKR